VGSHITWGFDVLARLDDIVNGTTRADYVINREFAGSPHDLLKWAGRYIINDDFPNGAFDGDGEANAIRDAVAAYNGGSAQAWILPIFSPKSSTNVITAGTISDGTTDGNRFCNAIDYKVQHASHLSYPGSHVLYSYLNVDAGMTLGLPYWTGWARAVNGFHSFDGHFPFYAAAYLAQNDSSLGQRNAQIMEFAGGADPNAACHRVWENTPESENYTYCSSPGPGWGPPGQPPPYVPGDGLSTGDWQYGIDTGCGGNGIRDIDVDLDSSSPYTTGPFNDNETDFMLWCH
jgi:hypothetical protein